MFISCDQAKEIAIYRRGKLNLRYEEAAVVHFRNCEECMKWFITAELRSDAKYSKVNK